MAVLSTLVTKVGTGGKVEFVLPEAKEGEVISTQVESASLAHPRRFGWAPGSVVSVGSDFDKPWVPDDVE